MVLVSQNRDVLSPFQIDVYLSASQYHRHFQENRFDVLVSFSDISYGLGFFSFKTSTNMHEKWN